MFHLSNLLFVVSSVVQPLSAYIALMLPRI